HGECKELESVHARFLLCMSLTPVRRPGKQPELRTGERRKFAAPCRPRAPGHAPVRAATVGRRIFVSTFVEGIGRTRQFDCRHHGPGTICGYVIPSRAEQARIPYASQPRRLDDRGHLRRSRARTRSGPSPIGFGGRHWRSPPTAELVTLGPILKGSP